MLGYANKEEFLALDTTKDLYLNPKDRELFQNLIEKDGFVKDFEVDFKRKDGEKITVLLTAHVRRNENGEVIGYEGLSQDITEKKIIEEKLKDLNTWYLEVLGFATHELKQPMGVLKGYLIMLRDETIGPLSTDKQKQAINSMLRSTNRLIDMSDKYLRLSKIETGELEIIKKRFDLFQEVINPLARREMMNTKEKNMKIIIENQEAFKKVQIEADSLLIDVVYTNLVSNAIKYGRRGGKISLGFKKKEKSFIFNVRNEGKGINKNKLEEVFGKFVRLDEKSPLKGSGLGLYNTKGIIERHGGKIWVESEEGKWVNFIFTLPIN
jgi:PAS domain S-box-containing protein